MISVWIIRQDESIVLVRVQVTFATATRTHHDHIECHRRFTPPTGYHIAPAQIDNAPVQVVVDSGNQFLNFRRRHTIREQLGGDFYLRRLGVAHPGQRLRMGEQIDLFGHLRGGYRHRLVEVKNPHWFFVLIDHWHVS